MWNAETIKKSSRKALLRAIEICNGQEKLAERCQAAAKERKLEFKVTQRTIWKYLNRSKFGVAPQAVLLIESATNGKVSRSRLRPDLYPLARKKYPKEEV